MTYPVWEQTGFPEENGGAIYSELAPGREQAATVNRCLAEAQRQAGEWNALGGEKAGPGALWLEVVDMGTLGRLTRSGASYGWFGEHVLAFSGWS